MSCDAAVADANVPTSATPSYGSRSKNCMGSNTHSLNELSANSLDLHCCKQSDSLQYILASSSSSLFVGSFGYLLSTNHINQLVFLAFWHCRYKNPALRKDSKYCAFSMPIYSAICSNGGGESIVDGPARG
eukprot:scaffold8628_cov149-Amphora_coffeaeformis.AAC.2